MFGSGVVLLLGIRQANKQWELSGPYWEIYDLREKQTKNNPESLFSREFIPSCFIQRTKSIDLFLLRN